MVRTLKVHETQDTFILIIVGACVRNERINSHVRNTNETVNIRGKNVGVRLNFLQKNKDTRRAETNF